jgi:HK97 family phage portal protein
VIVQVRHWIIFSTQEKQSLMNPIVQIKAKPTGVPSLRPIGGYGLQWFGGHTLVLDGNANNYVQQGYMGNSDVYSIVSQSARKFASIPVGVYKIKDTQEGRKAFKAYKTLTSGNMNKAAIERAVLLRTKSLEEADENNPIAKLLKNPNSYEGQDSFFEKVFTYKLVTGGAAIYKNMGGLEKGPVLEMEVLPSQFLQIKGDGTLFGVESYRLLMTNMEFTTEEIIYWKYANIDFALNGRQLYGMSPLRAGINQLQASNDAVKATVAMFQNGGARGVLFDDNSIGGLSKEQAEQLQGVADMKINDLNSKGRVITAASKLGYIQLGLSTVDMQLLEAINMTGVKLCNLYNFPPGLLKPDSTYDNRNADMKYFITNKIIPEWCSFRDELNRSLIPDFGNSGLFIDFDVQDLPELQEDMEKLVNTLKMADWLTDDEKRLMMRQEPKGGAYDTAYKSGTMMPIDHVFEGTGAPLDQPTQDTAKGIY